MDQDAKYSILASSFAEWPEMLTAKELEAILKIDVKTIYSYVQRGLIPYIRIESNVRFLKQEILKWIVRKRYRLQPTNGNDAKRHQQPVARSR